MILTIVFEVLIETEFDKVSDKLVLEIDVKFLTTALIIYEDVEKSVRIISCIYL